MAHIPVEDDTHKLVKKIRNIEGKNFDRIVLDMTELYIKENHKNIYDEYIKNKGS